MSLVALSVMTGLLHVVTDEDAALLWWGHIHTMVGLVIFAMSGDRGGGDGRRGRDFSPWLEDMGIASFLLHASLRLRSDEPVWDPTSRGNMSLGGLYWLDWQRAGSDSSL